MADFDDVSISVGKNALHNGGNDIAGKMGLQIDLQIATIGGVSFVKTANPAANAEY